MSGTFRPTNSTDGSDDALPPPAPMPSSTRALSTFQGASPNGLWSLVVVDDASADAGAITGGWCLTVTTQAQTMTKLATSKTPSPFGQPVTLTAIVTAGGAPVTAGTVQFSDGGIALGAPVVVGADGTAQLITSALGVRTHSLWASYTGSADFLDSADTVNQVVERAPTLTTVVASTNPSNPGESVTFTATVVSLGTPVTSGSVHFLQDGGRVAEDVALVGDPPPGLHRRWWQANTKSLLDTLVMTRTRTVPLTSSSRQSSRLPSPGVPTS